MSGFHKPEPPQRISLLLVGSYAAGKSHVLHTFPGLGVIDTQNGESAHFVARADRGEFPQFVTADAVTFEEINALLRSIKNGKPHLQTTGIDGLTPPHRELYKRFTSTKSDRAWTNEGEILRIEGEFGDLLRSLPMHIVATAEPRDVRAKPGDKVDGKIVAPSDVKVEKVAPRFKDSIGHVFDFIVFMRREQNGDSIAKVLKSKDESKIRRGEEIRNLSFPLLQKRLGLGSAEKPPLRGEALANAIVAGEVDEPAIDDDGPITADMVRAIQRAAAETRTTHAQLADITIRITKSVHDFRQTSMRDARSIFDELARAKQQGAA